MNCKGVYKMLKKHEIIDRIINTGVVAVVRAENLEEAKRVSNACIYYKVLQSLHQIREKQYILLQLK